MYVLAGLAALQMVECARITPDYLAFFNELRAVRAGGRSTWCDSNIDWGQDVKKLGHVAEDAHGGIAAGARLLFRQCADALLRDR